MNVNICFMPDNVTVTVKKGTTLLRAAQQARVHIRTRCGGKASCLMCKVKVLDREGCSMPEAKEIRKLGDWINSGYRLACQARAVSAVTVDIPEDPLKAAIRKQLAAQRQNEL